MSTNADATPAAGTAGNAAAAPAADTTAKEAGSRDRLWLSLSLIVMVLGIVVSIIGYFISHNTNNSLTQNDALTIAIIGISVTVAGRACAKRMKRPISAARCGIPPTGHQVPRSAPPGPHTRLSVRITAMPVFRGRFFGEMPGVDGWDEVGRR